MSFDWNQISHCTLVPLPLGVCEACIGEGAIYPELWWFGEGRTLEGEPYDLFDPCWEYSESASCVACKGTGST